jgi:hypothetical protein
MCSSLDQDIYRSGRYIRRPSSIVDQCLQDTVYAGCTYGHACTCCTTMPTFLPTRENLSSVYSRNAYEYVQAHG